MARKPLPPSQPLPQSRNNTEGRQAMLDKALGDIIKRYGVRAVMGKGGMGTRTLDAMAEAGAVYLNAIGGAAQYYARCIEKM